MAWDPVGKYLASQADDKTLIIHRINDWGIESSIKSPFQQAPSSTYFRRLAWSPNGSLICSANGENGNIPSSPIVSRDGWSCDMGLYGHQSPVECVVNF